MSDVPASDGRTGGGRYIQDPVTGILTKEVPAIEQPSFDQALPAPPIEAPAAEVAPEASDKKGTK